MRRIIRINLKINKNMQKKENGIKIFILALSLAALGAACTPGGVGTLDDGGIWFSGNKGETWEQRSLIYADRAIRKSIADDNIKKIVFSPADERRLLAIAEKEGLWLSWNAGRNWDQILAAKDVNDVAIDENNPNIIYSTSGPNLVRSQDYGDSWSAIYTNDNTNEFITAIALRPGAPQTIYAGTSAGRLVKSDNNGQSWQEQSNLEFSVNKLSFGNASSTLMFIGVKNKGLGRSQNFGEDWYFFKDEFKTYGGAAEFRDFALTPNGIIYASRYGLLRSLNQGNDWTSLPLIADERDSNIYSLAVNKDNASEIYYGTKNTFYHSIDGGFNWVPRRLPTSRAATALIINPADANAIYLGAWRLNQ